MFIFTPTQQYSNRRFPAVFKKKTVTRTLFKPTPNRTRGKNVRRIRIPLSFVSGVFALEYQVFKNYYYLFVNLYELMIS